MTPASSVPGFVPPACSSRRGVTSEAHEGRREVDPPAFVVNVGAVPDYLVFFVASEVDDRLAEHVRVRTRMLAG